MSEPSESNEKRSGRSPILEWVFGGIGLALTLSMIGFIGWQAVTHPSGEPPRIELRVEEVARVGDGYVAEVVARNRSRTTAKGVEVEAILSPDSAESETSSVTFDYIPGGSSVRGAVHFSTDPSAHQVRLRTVGHVEP